MSKVIVFDLDDTLGHFVQLSKLDWILTNARGKVVKRNHFNEILDLFPLVFRPRVFEMMEFLKREMMRHMDIQVMIYTNNTGCKMWVHRIKSYIEKKIKYKLFNRVICGWKYDGNIIEPNRTGYDKKYSDLIKCGHLHKNDEILFLDDQYHPYMIHPKIKYLHLERYVYNYSNMMARYLTISKLSKKQTITYNSRSMDPIQRRVNLREFEKKGILIENEIKLFVKDALSGCHCKRSHTRKNVKRGTRFYRKTKYKNLKTKSKKKGKERTYLRI